MCACLQTHTHTNTHTHITHKTHRHLHIYIYIPRLETAMNAKFKSLAFMCFFWFCFQLHKFNYDTGKALQALVKCPAMKTIEKKWGEEDSVSTCAFHSRYTHTFAFNGCEKVNSVVLTWESFPDAVALSVLFWLLFPVCCDYVVWFGLAWYGLFFVLFCAFFVVVVFLFRSG